MTKPIRAALYARVSTSGHGQDVGLQLDELRQVGAQHRTALVGTPPPLSQPGFGSAARADVREDAVPPREWAPWGRVGAAGRPAVTAQRAWRSGSQR